MKKLTFTLTKGSIIAVESAAHRWKLTFTDKNGSHSFAGLSAARVWVTIQNVAAQLPAKQITDTLKNKRQRTALGAEWAALRAMNGTRPLICPVEHTGLWLYVERTDADTFELRVVEPLGERHTPAIRLEETKARRLIALARGTPRKKKTPHSTLLSTPGRDTAQHTVRRAGKHRRLHTVS